MDHTRPSAADDARTQPAPPVRNPPWWNLPNLLSAIRLGGSLVLVALAAAGGGPLVVPLIAVLLATDWIDGKLAVWMGQQTRLGARLDSLADATFYGSVLVSLALLKTQAILAEGWWIAAALGSYAASALASLAKFGAPAAYHTRAAKSCWLLVSLAILATLADWSPWPLRIAASAVTLTNLEALLITLVLSESRVDVTSLYHVLRARRGGPAQRRRAR